MVEVRAHVERAFRLAAAPDAAWAFLADVPRWGALFPRVASVEPHPAGPDAFLWRMDPLGPPGFEVRTVYACRYHHGPGHDLTWTPIQGVGNARFEGGVRLADGEESGTAGALRLEATLEVPAPRFVRAVVEAAVNVEMGRMTDTFLTRLDRALRDGA